MRLYDLDFQVRHLGLACSPRLNVDRSCLPWTHLAQLRLQQLLCLVGSTSDAAGPVLMFSGDIVFDEFVEISAVYRSSIWYALRASVTPITLRGLSEGSCRRGLLAGSNARHPDSYDRKF